MDSKDLNQTSCYYVNTHTCSCFSTFYESYFNFTKYVSFFFILHVFHSPSSALMMLATGSVQLKAAIAWYVPGRFFSHSFCPTAQIAAISGLLLVMVGGILFHRNFALHLQKKVGIKNNMRSKMQKENTSWANRFSQIIGVEVYSQHLCVCRRCRYSIRSLKGKIMLN